MILSKVQTSTKQRTEFRLLVAIRFACLMAIAKGHTNPMDCQRVQARCAELAKHFAYNHPSPAFHSQFIGHAGELGPSFCLRFTEPKQGLYGSVMVWSNETAPTNVHQLSLSRA
ncbi:hypothetical protein [Shewanella baltica]|uniref:hypothetical protein n=1 Tax=Shewanella baltica TaxID=62322 RepID=UPI0021679714|nr:hypothetical protein [Shewanella baltica]MCS6114492.1 hypothetical protein [Shewanella baltica]UVW65398.1 hypothetical protein HHE93_18220 [Shewanella baltica]